VLSGTPLQLAPPPAPSPRATVFDPRVDVIVAAVDSAAYFPWIKRLSGGEAVTVGGSSHTFTSRYSLSPQCDLAEQYVYERFQALSFDAVEYDPHIVFGSTARNVIATQLGAENPEQVVIVCGHLDSTSPNPSASAPGANDNASGAAGVLLAAERMRPWTFRATVRFVAFTGEEQGLYGSDHYAALVAASPDSVLGVVNLDMIAWWETLHQIDIEGEAFCSAIMQVMNDACTRYTTLAGTYDWNPWGSDHVSFSNRGMPAFLAIESDYANYPCYHRTCDTWDQNLGGFGAEVVRAAIATAAQLAGVVGAVPAPATADMSPLALQAHPSPFDDAVTIWLAGPATARGLAVYDVRGRQLRTLPFGAGAASGVEVRWDGRTDDGRPVPAGVYFMRLLDGASDSAVKVVRRR
jgi:hypothetical protein